MARESGQTRDMLTSTPQLGSESVTQQLILWSMAVIGLVAMGLAVWFVYMQNSLTESPLPVAPALTINTRATRDARQNEIAAYQAMNEALRAEIGALNAQLERTQADLTHAQALANQRPASDRQWSVTLDQPPLALILDAPLLQQERSLSCEASAAAMAAQYHRLSISESEILSALPLHENPHLGFRGNVDGPYGGLTDYGVYATPIHRVLSDRGLQVELFSGGVAEIKEHIRQGRPVLAWITYDLQVQAPQERLLAGPNNQPQTVTLVAYEHAILIVGYNREGLWIHDPFDGTRGFYSESEFLRSFGYLGRMALVVGPPR
jgi:uncharacterized protein YvpB